MLINLGGNRQRDISPETIDGVQTADLVNPAIADVRAEAFLHLIYGQSLAQGTRGQPALSLVPAHGGLMFNAGIRPSVPDLDIPEERESLVPHVEVDSTTSQRGETVAFSAQEGLAQIYKAQHGLSEADRTFISLSAIAGGGGKTARQLAPGTGFFTALLANLTYGVARLNDLGITRIQPLLTFIATEADTSGTTTEPAVYNERVEAIRTALQAEWRSLSGDASAILPMQAPQNASWSSPSREVPVIAMAQVDHARANPGYLLTGPAYQYPHPDNLHMSNLAYFDLGLALAQVWYRTQMLGQTHLPILVESVERAGAEVLVTFSGVDRLAIDTIHCAPVQDYGVSLWADPDSSPTVNPGDRYTLTNVKLFGPRSILIKASAPIDAGADLRIGWYGTPSRAGPTEGPRTNLRRLGQTWLTTTQGRRAIREWVAVQRFAVA